MVSILWCQSRREGAEEQYRRSSNENRSASTIEYRTVEGETHADQASVTGSTTGVASVPQLS